MPAAGQHEPQLGPLAAQRARTPRTAGSWFLCGQLCAGIEEERLARRRRRAGTAVVDAVVDHADRLGGHPVPLDEALLHRAGDRDHEPAAAQRPPPRDAPPGDLGARQHPGEELVVEVVHGRRRGGLDTGGSIAVSGKCSASSRSGSSSRRIAPGKTAARAIAAPRPVVEPDAR